MLYSSTCAYAVRALSRLAAGSEEPLVKLQDLAHDEQIPYPFLAKICHDLVTAGLLRSSRGPRGGYALARDPSRISLYEIRAVVDGVEDLNTCVLGLTQCRSDRPCALHESWKLRKTEIERYLRGTTLVDTARALAATRARRRTPSASREGGDRP
jgi:Rrf2 family transcriptional regulator, iron-sulfur cluster assembly transcription factor